LIRKNSTESLFVNMIHKKPVTSCRLGQYTDSGTKINSFQIQAEGGEEYESLPKNTLFRDHIVRPGVSWIGSFSACYRLFRYSHYYRCYCSGCFIVCYRLSAQMLRFAGAIMPVANSDNPVFNYSRNFGDTVCRSTCCRSYFNRFGSISCAAYRNLSDNKVLLRT